MSVRCSLRVLRRACPVGVLLLLLLALSAWSLTRAPGDALASGGVWKGTAEGIRVDHSELQSDGVTSSSVANYQVELSFSFSVRKDGEVTGSGSGYYTDAHWHLYGVNGENGSFDCEPPVSTNQFGVQVSGHKSGHEVLLALAIPDAAETNEAYDCGANYTGFATTSNFMAESLDVVGGHELHLSSTAPTSLTLEKTVEAGDSETSKTHLHIWSFSVAPPGSESPSESGSGGAAGRACSLSLTRVVARPSPAHAGQPIIVSFHVSAAAKASLLISPLGGTPSIVVARKVPKGLNQLVWGGWLGTMPAPAGQYALTVQAKGCRKLRTHVLTVTTQ
jgi:hypothetical protein